MLVNALKRTKQIVMQVVVNGKETGLRVHLQVVKTRKALVVLVEFAQLTQNGTAH